VKVAIAKWMFMVCYFKVPELLASPRRTGYKFTAELPEVSLPSWENWEIQQFGRS
jgi:hypothetical protein